jgi:hypothetical protein
MSYDATRRRLDALTDHVGFQDLVTILLTRTGVNVRPLGGPGDRGRDAVAGLYRAKGGEPLAVTISLERDWRAKIRADLKRIHDYGFRPKTVISVTNRLAAAPAQEALQAQVKKQYGVDLTIHEQRWLVMQLRRRDNLDLLGEYLHLPPPRPRFFLDLIGLCHVGAGGRPVRRSHRGAGRLHSGQAPAQQASRTCSSPSSCHKVRPTPPVLGVAAVPGSESRGRPRPG